MDKRFNICGYGFVGKATHLLLKEIGISDENIGVITLSKDTSFQFNENTINFICLPTPTKKDGTQDIYAIEDWVSKISSGIIVIRSTVLPETCNRLQFLTKANIVFMPEFLTEKTMYEDAVNPDIIVIGTDNKDTEFLMYSLLKPYKERLIFTDRITAETAKYAINCFYALKVIYANQLFDFCQEKWIDYDAIKKIMYNRKWIGNNHLEIFFNGKRGVRGHCLPKDLKAFAALTDSTLLKTVLELNEPLVKDG
mgnify:CR=1 FL=1